MPVPMAISGKLLPAILTWVRLIACVNSNVLLHATKPPLLVAAEVTNQELVLSTGILVGHSDRSVQLPESNWIILVDSERKLLQI